MYRKDTAADLLISLGILALSLAAVLSVARRAFFFPENFAERLSSSLADPRVAACVADRVTDMVLVESPDLTAFRPFILSTAQGTVASESFRALVRSSARAAHHSLFSEGGRSVILSVPDVGVLLKSALAKANPALAEKIPPSVRAALATLGRSQADQLVLRLWRASRRSAQVTLGLFLIGAAMVVAGFATASSRRRALLRLGLDLLVAGLLLWLSRPAGRTIVSLLPHDALARGAAAGLWDAFFAPLRTWALAFCSVGLVLTAAGHSLLQRLDPAASLRRALAWIEAPAGGPRVRAARSALLVLAGAFAIYRPREVLTFMVVAAGAGLAFGGLREIFELILRAPADGHAQEPASGSSVRLRVTAVVAVAALFVLAIVLVSREPERTAAATDACNGATALCSRRLDEVVFPATHNSMSSADIPSWLFPQQERGIAGQLEDGIRGLLFDVHHGIPVGDKVKTDLDSERGSREKFEKALGKEAVDAAMRIRDRLVGQEEGRRGLYLCHGFCELGATPLAAALREIREFLAGNPDEVLVLVIEDYVTPEDLARDFAAAGLDGLVYRGPLGPPWPTLREMIDSRQRVLVLTESGNAGVPWIHPAFEVMQETPYHFESAAALSCAANRGGSGGSLFLMNNWIDTTPAPKPSNAAIVNAYDALLARARQCASERGRAPSLIAVDFYRTGALFQVARTLNGLDAPGTAGTLRIERGSRFSGCAADRPCGLPRPRRPRRG